ncbi:MAG TPA: tape measure protein [Pseudomonas sp.]|nr:tape measure protein [Pseudomonas sp.]
MSEYARLVVAVDSTQVTRADAVMGQFERTATSLERRTDSLASTFSRLKGPLAAITAGLSVKGIIDTADNYGQMADRIKMATGSAEEFNQVQARLLQSANSTYRPLVEAQELFIQTADTLRTLGNETSDVLDITDSFSYLLVTNAASADRAKNAIDAYSKSIQKGKIDADAWASILAAMPTLVGTIARETGKSEAEIRSLGVNGKLSLADLNEGLRLSVDANKALADGMGTTLNDAIVRARNNLSAYLGQSDKVTSASGVLSGALDLVSDNLDTVATIAGGVAVAAAARYGVTMTQNAIASVAAAQAAQRQTAEELKLALAHEASTAAALAQARANVGLAGTIGQVATATAAHEAAQKRLAAAQSASVGMGRTVLGLAGGWVGLGVMAASVAASFVSWGDGAEEAARKSIALREETNLLTRAVQELDAAQARQVLQRMEEPYKQAQTEARNYAALVEYLNVQLRDLPGSKMVEKWRRDLVDAEGNLSTTNQELAKQEAKMAELRDRIKESSEARRADVQASADQEANQKALAKTYESQLAALQRQKSLHGEVTEAARISYEIQSGALQGLGNKEAGRIMGLAQELDARKELTEQQKAQIALLRESGQLRAANDAQWQLEYAEKIAFYEEQGNQAAADRLRTLKAIREIQMESVQEPGTVEGVTKAPVSGGLDAAVGGANSEIARLNEQTILLDQWRTTELEKHRQFMEAKAITSGEYAKRETNIHEQHAAGAQKIERAKNQAIMASSAEFFGNMAALSQSENKKIATIGKMSAIAQATIQGALAAQMALAAAPPPLNFALAASVGVATAANIATISGVGFATGGYTGPGGKHEPAGVVHRGEVVWSQEDIRRAGGVGVVEAMRLGKPGFYDGGVVDMAPVRARQQQPAIPAGDASSAAPLSITHVWQITPGMNDAIQAEITRMLPMITEATARGVQQQISRGGSMARSVGRR